MTRYAAGQFAVAFVAAAVGTIKGYRLWVDWVDDQTCRWTWLT